VSSQGSDVKRGIEKIFSGKAGNLFYDLHRKSTTENPLEK